LRASIVSDSGYFSGTQSHAADPVTRVNHFGEMNKTIPDPNPPVMPQSLQSRTLFPGITKAARDLEISRAHLFAVLVGERRSGRTLRRWDAWLKLNPDYASLQRKTPEA